MARSVKQARAGAAPRKRRRTRQRALPASPDRIGSWQLVRLAAEGAFSIVYQARAADSQDPSRAPYALKLLKRPWQDDPAALRLLRREARVGRSVSHPHLAPVLAAHVHEPPFYVVMPWLEGCSLASLLAAEGPPPLSDALWIVRQTAEALDALHASGWLHADVKPANVMVSPEGHATLIDLGFAQRANEALAAADRVLAGTIAYMAPERLTSALCSDIRGDIFSLGVTFYELVTGQLPFAAGDMAALVRAHRQDEPREVRHLAPLVPQPVAQLIHQMLAKEPLRRPQTPAELIARLATMEIETFATEWA